MKKATYIDRNGIPAKNTKSKLPTPVPEMFGPCLDSLDRPIHPDLRQEVYRAGGNQCYYCGCRVTRKTRTIDHMVPLSRGGMSSAKNLVLACATCNFAKKNLTVREWSAAGYLGKNTVGATK